MIRISRRQFYLFALAWSVVSWIVAIHFFSIGALLVSPLIWLAGNAVRSVLFPVRLDLTGPPETKTGEAQ